VAKHHEMEKRAPPGRFRRRLEKRVERKGLRPRYAASVIVVSWGAGIVVFGVVEHLIDPETFDNVWLAMWWAIQTVTTVGYGDVVPAQTAGKVIASVLMLGGLSLYAVVTGVITSVFVTRAQADREAAEDDPIMQRLEELNRRLDTIKADLARLERGTG
jgi:voltage-gated potassium channel